MRKVGEWWGDRFSSPLDAAPNVSVTLAEEERGRTCRRRLQVNFTIVKSAFREASYIFIDFCAMEV